VLAVQQRADAQIVAFRGPQHAGHGRAHVCRGRPGAAHHHAHDVRIEHALHRDAFGSAGQTGNAAHRVHQRFAVMRPGAANECAVDVEQNQRPVLPHSRKSS
jgi:hypothetical protein